jgi:hypothetical protein
MLNSIPDQLPESEAACESIHSPESGVVDNAPNDNRLLPSFAKFMINFLDKHLKGTAAKAGG